MEEKNAQCGSRSSFEFTALGRWMKHRFAQTNTSWSEGAASLSSGVPEASDDCEKYQDSPRFTTADVLFEETSVFSESSATEMSSTGRQPDGSPPHQRQRRDSAALPTRQVASRGNNSNDRNRGSGTPDAVLVEHLGHLRY